MTRAVWIAGSLYPHTCHIVCGKSWTLCLIGMAREIDSHSRIVIDLRRTPFVLGSVNQKVYVTIGEVGENKLDLFHIPTRKKVS